jgi:quercetin dioxygenase-like cupin family protein
MTEKSSLGLVLHLLADFRWAGAADEPYKTEGDHFRHVRRVNLVGMHGENTDFHLRYFEVGEGGFTSREHHEHEHVIVVLRGEGDLLLGENWRPLKFGDVARVASGTSHQLRNDFAEPFGFLCIVDAHRDKPVVETASPGDPIASLCGG